MPTNPDPGGADQPATAVRVEIRDREGQRACLVSLPLDEAALADLLETVAPGAKPHLEVTVPTAEGVRTVLAWRIQSIVSLDDTVLYVRRLPQLDASDDGDTPADLVYVTVTRRQAEQILAGQTVRVEQPAREGSPRLVVVVRLSLAG
jgi:hypothetical protein